jgi:hypothetical protein
VTCGLDQVQACGEELLHAVMEVFACAVFRV